MRRVRLVANAVQRCPWAWLWPLLTIGGAPAVGCSQSDESPDTAPNGDSTTRDSGTAAATVEDSMETRSSSTSSNSAAPDSGSATSATESATADTTSNDSSNASTEGITYVKASNPGVNDSFGATLALSRDGNTFAVAANFEASASVGVNGEQDNDSAVRAGAVYVFTRRDGTWQQQAYLKASNTGEEARFGSALALSADGNMLVVGAPDENGGASGVDGDQTAESISASGAVYVFQRAGEAWTQQAYVKASNPAEDDAFGISLALSSDGNTLVVGADEEDSASTGVNGNQDDDSALDSGAVYVFSREGNTWQQNSYLKSSNAQAGDRFGAAVTLSSDGNVLAVGAYWEDGGATGVNGDPEGTTNDRSGAAYVFTRSDDTWLQQAYFKPAQNNGAGGDAFGCSISLSADGTVLAVGAAGESSATTGVDGNALDATAPYAGAAYVFTGSGSQWQQQAYLKASNASEGDEFGFHVLVSADGTRVLVGAALEGSNSTGINGAQSGTAAESGAVYVFGGTDGTFEQEGLVKASNTASGDRFGWALALSEDNDRLVVGAIGEAGSSSGINGNQGERGLPGAGAVYIYDDLSADLRR